ELDVMGPAMAVAKELTSVPSFASPDLSKPFAAEKEVLKKLKKAVLMVAGKAAQTFGPKLNDEQEILMNLADMVIEIYVAESTLLRTEKLIGVRGEEACKLQTAMTQVYLYEAVQKVSNAGNEAVACFTHGDEMKVMLMGMKRFTKMDPVNTKELRRSIAEFMIEKNAFPY
ncbi:MAG: acyl-CoA dehydrogenase, partial [Bacteroidota bacterium]